ncbi:MAG: [FeFe] hydrogenase H-cluster radical SAM maturase HydE [Alphaproteobacteria bacterium]|nr:[FeFe] hydrogenase H-cluster radical SAM maturase HydE [Alphaproteobacteria bacterium]
MRRLIEKAENDHSLEKAEIVSLLRDEESTQELLKAADRVREKYVGSDVHLRALIEFSNFCRQNCCYCGIRRDNRQAQRYRMSPEEIVLHATAAAKIGFHTVVMQSGEDVTFTVDKMTQIIREIKKLDMAVTLSIGEKSFEEYQAYREAGADRYLLRIETTDKDLYHRLDPGMSWDNRCRCLKDLKSLGYELGSGSMVGLPDQSIESIADDILFFKEIGVDMAGIGPFIPHEQTPLANAKGREFVLSLKTMAMTRLLLPDINIPATTAMETLNPNGRIIALQSGANVVMPNVTQGEYRKKYELYPGKICVNDTPAKCRTCIEYKILSIGRTIGASKGFRGEFLKR